MGGRRRGGAGQRVCVHTFVKPLHPIPSPLSFFCPTRNHKPRHTTHETQPSGISNPLSV